LPEYTTRPLERWVAQRNLTPTPKSGMSFGSVMLLVASAAGVAFYFGRKSNESRGTGAGIRASNPSA